MRVLQIEEADRDRIKKLMAYANQHTLSLEDLKKTMAGEIPAVGDSADHVLYLRDGFRIAFSYEMQPAGKCAHISISISPKGKALPHPTAVDMIMGEFGMGKLDKALSTWVEQGRSVNILSKVESDGERKAM